MKHWDNLLVAEGFSSIEDIKDSKLENLTKIEGIEEETAKELIDRAKEFYQKDQEEISNRVKDLGLDKNLNRASRINSWYVSNSW